MKLTLVFLFCVVSVWSSPRFKRQMYGDINLKSIPAIMKNEAAVNTHCNCMITTPEEAKIKCDRMGTKLRDQFPRLLQKGDCPDGCTQAERETSAFIVETLRDKYPHCWFKVVAAYNVTAQHLKILENFLETAKVKPAT